MKHDEDDDTQVYADTLLLVYQRGFADGKRSAQRKPLTPAEIAAFVGTHHYGPEQIKWFRLGEAAHNIKEGT